MTASLAIGLILLLRSVVAAPLDGHPIGNGAGMSYWGEIPAPADSVTRTYENAPIPAWARAVDIPFDAIGLPFRAFTAGVKATVVFLDERHVIHHLGRILGPRELPYGLLLNASAGGLTGTGAGATLVHDAFFGPHNRFRLGFRVTNTGNNRILLGTHFGVGQRLEYQLGAGFRARANARYFGVGPATGEDDESFYRHELGWFGLAHQRRLTARLAAEVEALYSISGAYPTDEDAPPLESKFAGEPPPGFRRRSDGVTLGLSFLNDTSTETGRPEGSYYRRLHASYFTSTRGPSASFWTCRAELQQFIPLWFSRRAFAMRALYTWIDPVSGTIVPFQRLMTNDDPDLLRGYEDFRWLDRGLAAVSAEYRWPIWAHHDASGPGFDSYVFTDVGQVFDDPADIAADDLSVSYGGGVRVVARSGFVGRLELGISEETTVLRLRADQIFQFEKGGLYHGRNPVPSR